jgi:hypothetical protein
MRKNWFVLLAVLLVLVAFTGCQKGPKVKVEQWEIPFLNSLTGPIASIGEFLHWGAERAAKEINEAGGLLGKPVKIIGVDTALDPQKGVVEMGKIVQSSLVALGPVPEPVIMAAMPIAVENEMMSMTATTSLEYAEKFFPWSISWFPKTEDRLPPLVSLGRAEPEVKSVVRSSATTDPAQHGRLPQNRPGAGQRQGPGRRRGSRGRGHLRSAGREGPQPEAGRHHHRLLAREGRQADPGAEEPRLEGHEQHPAVLQRG